VAPGDGELKMRLFWKSNSRLFHSFAPAFGRLRRPLAPVLARPFGQTVRSLPHSLTHSLTHSLEFHGIAAITLESSGCAPLFLLHTFSHHYNSLTHFTFTHSLTHTTVTVCDTLSFLSHSLPNSYFTA
jgi:hypothetical protein